jgi:acid phosphatase
VVSSRYFALIEDIEINFAALERIYLAHSYDYYVSIMKKLFHPLLNASVYLLVSVIWLISANQVLAQQRQYNTVKSEKVISSPVEKRLANIGEIKTALTKYHDCQPDNHLGCYEKDLSAVCNRAKTYLQHHLKSVSKPAMVLDIDETSLSNWEEIKADDYGFHAKIWNDWVDSAKAPAIAPMLELYRFARQKNVAVFFITGRREPSRQVTEKNLQAAGYSDWQQLVLRPKADKPCENYPNRKETSEVVCYKATERRKIADQGFHIILNLGDQMSDLRGGHAQRAYKLPNPFYYIP